MDAELKRKWVEALRSGEFLQTTGALYRNEGYCCLGVLWERSGREWNDKRNGVASVMIKTFQKLFESEFGISQIDCTKLAAMNDAGKSFAVIADYIEQNL